MAIRDRLGFLLTRALVLIAALDVLLSGGAYSFIVFTTVAQAVTVWLLWRAAVADGPRDLAVTKGCLMVLAQNAMRAIGILPHRRHSFTRSS